MAEHIEQYDINVSIEQSGSLTISESILYDFGTEKKHGIFRDIPFQIKRYGLITNIGLSKFSVTMDGEMVHWQSYTQKSDKAGIVEHIAIGNDSVEITGKHRYEIQYSVKKGVLPASDDENKDAIRWNVIGTGWNLFIKNINANFYLPTSLNKKNIVLHTYTGVFGESNSIAKPHWLSSQHVNITVQKLFPQNGLTVEMIYPSNTLDQNGLLNVSHTVGDWIDGYGYIMVFFIYIGLFYFLSKMYSGKIDLRATAVQYDPPKGLSLLQSGMIYDGRADTKDMVPAILELAHFGFLKILKKDESSTAVLKKIKKSRQTLTEDQKYLLDKVLFKGKETFSVKKGTDKKARKVKKGFNDINRILEKWSQKELYTQEDPKKTRNTFLQISLLALFPYALVTIISQFSLFGSDALFVVLFPIIFGVPIIATLVAKETSLWVRVINVAIGFFIFSPMYFFPIKHDMNPYEVMFGPMAVLICTMVAWVYFYAYFGAQYSEKGASTKKHLDGLKEFMTRVKEDELRRRLQEEPDYLERLLPYAMMFNITTHWLDLFETMHVSSPQWYSGDMRGISNIHSAMTDMSQTNSSRSSSSSHGGGGYSGSGGSSGGGSGGGGGGSW